MTFIAYVGIFVELNWFPSCCCFIVYAEFSPQAVEMPVREMPVREMPVREMLIPDNRPRIGGYRNAGKLVERHWWQRLRGGGSME